MRCSGQTIQAVQDQTIHKRCSCQIIQVMQLSDHTSGAMTDHQHSAVIRPGIRGAVVRLQKWCNVQTMPAVQ